jgi:hypothetical protein
MYPHYRSQGLGGCALGWGGGYGGSRASIQYYPILLSFYMEQNNNNPLTILNANHFLDISPLFENYLHNNDDAGIFSFINIKSDYFNCSS